jgi:hypothetical protein
MFVAQVHMRWDVLHHFSGCSFWNMDDLFADSYFGLFKSTGHLLQTTF